MEGLLARFELNLAGLHSEDFVHHLVAMLSKHRSPVHGAGVRLI